MMFIAKLLPETLLLLRKHQYDLKCLVISPEDFQGMHQHRFITHGKELFGKITSHSQALSTGDNDYIFLHDPATAAPWQQAGSFSLHREETIGKSALVLSSGKAPGA